MYAKTEIYYMMRDKVIPSLINSEKIIKFEDIKEVLEKSSYWKNESLKYKKNKSSNFNHIKLTNKNKNKKQSVKMKKSTNNIFTSLNHKIYEIKDLNKKNFNDLLQINKDSNKSRNYKNNNLFNSQNDQPILTYNFQKTSINFRNPILKSFSNKLNKYTETSNSNIYPIKTERIHYKKNAFVENKKNLSERNKKFLFFKNFKNNDLRNIKNDYDYKIVYYFHKNKIKKYKLGNKIIKKDEENNHLILRGLALNDEIKDCYSKCQLINVDLDDNKNSKNILKTISNSEECINRKKGNNHKKYFIKNRNDFKFNISYSLKDLLNFKCPINIKKN